MDANQWLALFLLFGRLGTVFFMLSVLRIQYKLKGIKDAVSPLRKTMLWLSTTILLGNAVPIIIDTLGIFGKGSFGLLIAYVISNNITALLAAIMVWQVYRLAKE